MMMEKSLGIAEMRESIIEDNINTGPRYADEEVESEYGYFTGYETKSIADQIAILHQLSPKIAGSADENIATGELPPKAEGWYAIPRWEEIAPTYGEAVKKVFDLVDRTYRGTFYNYLKGSKLGVEHLRQHPRTASAFYRIGKEQKGHGILIVPLQLGLLHRGRSVRRARELMDVSEFGLGAFAVGVILLTHPDRLMNQDDLGIDCAGDEFTEEIGNEFFYAPTIYYFGDEGIKIGEDLISGVFDDFGSASGFLL